jgi:dipeptidyl-peptidase-4
MWMMLIYRRSFQMTKDKFMKYLSSTCIWIVLISLAVPVAARVPPETEARLRAIYERGEFRAGSFRAKWLSDSSGYTVLEPAAGSDAGALVHYSAASGQRTVMASVSQLTPPGESGPLTINDYEISPDSRWLLLECRSRRQEAEVPEIWSFEFESGKLGKIADGRLYGISPNSDYVLYSEQGNLSLFNLHNNQTVTLTDNAVEDSVSNSRAVWSPDGKRIAFVESDVSDVRLRQMLVPGDPSYPEVKKVRFARVGGTIASLRVGVVDVQGTAIRWLSILQPPEGFYIEHLGWAANSHEVLVEKPSRFRDEREFLIADIRTGAVTCIYHEADPAWVLASYGVNAGLEWIRGGSAFIVLSEQDGWRHAYAIQRDGGEKVLLTPGASDIIRRERVDEAGSWFYYLASPDNATQRYLYRVRLDGRGTPEKITPSDQPGTHEYTFSPNAKWAFHTYSTFDTPPVTELIRLPEHKAVRVLEDNQKLQDRVDSWITHPVEFLQLDIGDDVVLDAYMIKPRDFDPSKKYPVFVYVYSEPHSQTVLDRWSTTNMFHRVIADLGYLVVSIDSRGTPAPKGAAWRRAIFPSLGPLSTEEQAAGLQLLGRTRPYVDLSRVGIWGWSGGGSNTLNAMFRKPEVYHVGIAVAPKPQPHLYNAWFQEIYMRTPEVNPEGYQRSAPINFAEGLKGDLLIIHGTGETNTHLEITEGLVDRLIELGKTFDYMAYPHRDHGIQKGKGTSIHLRLLITRYLLTHLPPGPN